MVKAEKAMMPRLLKRLLSMYSLPLHSAMSWQILRPLMRKRIRASTSLSTPIARALCLHRYRTGQVVEGTRTNVVNNQLVVITQPDSATEVTGLADIAKAKSIALADGSVPVGKYTRQAMINLGLLAEVEDPAAITTQEVSDQLGGVEISEQGNVSKVLAAVEEASCEVGTTYLSDTVGHEDGVKILEVVPYDVTGNIIYPVAQIVNQDADEAESAAAADFIAFITNDDAKALYQKYGFDTDVE